MGGSPVRLFRLSPAGACARGALVIWGHGRRPAVERRAGPPPGVVRVFRGAAASGPGRPRRVRRHRRGPGPGPSRPAGASARSTRWGRRRRGRRRRLGRACRDRGGSSPTRRDLRGAGFEPRARRRPKRGPSDGAHRDRGFRRFGLRARTAMAPTSARTLRRSVDGSGGTAHRERRRRGSEPEPPGRRSGALRRRPQPPRSRHSAFSGETTRSRSLRAQRGVARSSRRDGGRGAVRSALARG